MAIIAIIIASNCSRIPENNDPVIGIWVKLDFKTLSESNKQTLRQEWIFNDAYLGRYHKYTSSTLDFKTDFKWEQVDGVYTISYPGTDMQPVLVSMKESSEGVMLEADNGEVLATKD